MDIGNIMALLSQKRQIFHSEADFQFALAWEIKSVYPQAEIRLEVPSGTAIKGRIDIVVRLDVMVYPIELKYLKKKLKLTVSSEDFDLAEGVHDLDMHDCIKDIARLEAFGKEMRGFKSGYAIWLTNDSAYWDSDYKAGYYSAFHAPEGSVKAGTMQYSDGAKLLNDGKYKEPITLNGEYRVNWLNFSNLGGRAGLFKYALISVEKGDA